MMFVTGVLIGAAGMLLLLLLIGLCKTAAPAPSAEGPLRALVRAQREEICELRRALREETARRRRAEQALEETAALAEEAAQP